MRRAMTVACSTASLLAGGNGTRMIGTGISAWIAPAAAQSTIVLGVDVASFSERATAWATASNERRAADLVRAEELGREAAEREAAEEAAAEALRVAITTTASSPDAVGEQGALAEARARLERRDHLRGALRAVPARLRALDARLALGDDVEVGAHLALPEEVLAASKRRLRAGGAAAPRGAHVGRDGRRRAKGTAEAPGSAPSEKVNSSLNE